MHKSKIVMSLVVLSTFLATVAHASIFNIQGFETGTAGWNVYPDVGSSSFTRVPSGTNGIPSSSGNYHAEIFMDASVNATATAHGGAYTYPGGAVNLVPGFNKAIFSVDVYVDPAVGAVGEEWNMQNAFDFHNVTSTDSGNVTIGGDATKTFSFVCRKLDSNTWTLGRNSGTPDPIEVTSAGWYTLITEWTETEDGIVDYNWIDDGTMLHEVGPGVNVLGTTAESYSPRYMWLFGDGSDPTSKTVAIDNAIFLVPVPEPSTFVLAALGLLGLGWFVRRRKK